jgi:LuxR family maltose regulon positive regulatory protein
MGGGDGSNARRVSLANALGNVLVDAKVTRPLLVGAVVRPRLLDRLEQRRATPIVIIMAPAGYGKSGLLSQWSGAALGKRRVAWLTLDDDDNDPTVLVASLEAAFGRVGLDPAEPFLLAIDNAERLSNAKAINHILALSESAPPGTQIGIAMRGDGSWPVARLCASGRAMSLGPRDLALTEREATELIARVGLRAAPMVSRELVRRAEGWAAGLYLTALEAARDGTDPDRVPDPTSASALLEDYVMHDVLRELDLNQRAFLVRTSMLEVLDPSLCDAVLQTKQSIRMLRQIEERQGLVLRTSEGALSYRLPAMIREVLRRKLTELNHEQARLGFLRAAAWYEERDLMIEAAEQASFARDREALARLLPTALRQAVAAGQSRKAAGWVSFLESSPVEADIPEIAAPAALVYASAGDVGAAERWSEAAWANAMHSGNRERLAEASLARALVCRWGWSRMRSDARLALRLLPSRDGQVPVAHLLLGIADILGGEEERADVGLARAASGASAGPDAGWAAAIAFAFRASLAHGRRDRAAAEALLRPARILVKRMGLDGDPAGVLVRAVAARVAASGGLYAQARGDLELALENLSVVTAAIPWLAVRVLLDVGGTKLALGDVPGAREVLASLRRLLEERPGLGALAVEVDRLNDQIKASGMASQKGFALTAAELRLLPYLTTHLGMSQIAARLFVSTNTVKTEAKSIYHKLAVSNRAEAIDRAAEVGLLQPQGDLLGPPPSIAVTQSSGYRAEGYGRSGGSGARGARS